MNSLTPPLCHHESFLFAHVLCHPALLMDGVQVQRAAVPPAVGCCLVSGCDWLIGAETPDKHTRPQWSDINIFSPLGLQLSISHHRLMHQITGLCVKSESWGGGLMQSHVMAELKTCWRGEEEEEGMEGEMRRGQQSRGLPAALWRLLISWVFCRLPKELLRFLHHLLLLVFLGKAFITPERGFNIRQCQELHACVVSSSLQIFFLFH